MLDWLLPLVELAPATGDEKERLERLGGALLHGNTGREALDLAMGAVLVGQPSALRHNLASGDKVRCIYEHKSPHGWHYGDTGVIHEVFFETATVLWDHMEQTAQYEGVSVPRSELEKTE